jgi:uncharacterized protein (TIGR03435 family)
MMRLILLLILWAVNMFGLKAGDPAPEIDWSKVVHAPESAKYRPGLAGNYTVLRFLTSVTANAQAVDRWNEMNAKFADQGIQFVWVASEKWSAVEPFLREHPMNGWLLIDEKEELALAYGCYPGGEAVIDSSGKVAGFTSFLEAGDLTSFLAGKGALKSEPVRFDSPPAIEKPDFPPSEEVHISASKSQGTEGSDGPDYWVRRGFDLKAIVAEAWDKKLALVVVPETLDKDGTFDFAMVLPAPKEQRAIHELVQHAVERYFRIAVVAESKPADVYVLTALKGKTPKALPGDSYGGFASSTGFEFSPPPGIGNDPEAMKKYVEEMMKHPQNLGISSLSADGMTADDLAEMLEHSLGRPVINETGLPGVYNFSAKAETQNTEAFVRALREQLGLVLTSATRSVETLSVRPLN